MQVVNSSITIMDTLNESDLLQKIELAGRTCYKSEGRITKDSAKKFVDMIIKNGHLSVLEHASITVRIICDRGVSHELVRHRIASYSQESTRYVNYKKKDGCTFIIPSLLGEGANIKDITLNNAKRMIRLWVEAMQSSENAYNDLLDSGATPESARSVLPNSLKTEVVATMNIRTWRHVIEQRTSLYAHPDIRVVFTSLLKEFKKELPALFGDIKEIQPTVKKGE